MRERKRERGAGGVRHCESCVDDAKELSTQEMLNKNISEDDACCCCFKL